MRLLLYQLISAVLIIVSSPCAVPASTHAPPLELLTANETARTALHTYGFAAQAAGDGPEIAVTDLEVKNAEPFTLLVRIYPHDGTVPDLATLRIECLKQPVIDLTERLKPFMTHEGVKVDRTLLPTGLHQFRVSVNDVRGRLSEKDFTISVSGGF